MWGIIFGAMIAGTVAGAVFLWTRFCKFGIVKKLSGGRKWLQRLIGLIPMVILGIFMIFDPINTAVVIVHASCYWAVAELIAFLIRKISAGKETENDPEGAKDEKTQGFQIYRVGIIVLCIEIAYFSAGWYFANNVWEKDYQLETTKDLGMERLRIAQITDSHIGTTFDGEGFAAHLRTIQTTKPDILVITGDFVDDGTSMEDLLISCAALRDFECPYGKYFVYGNHDKGYYKHDFSVEELEAALEYGGVKVLQDEVALINDSIYIVGRQDKSTKNRVEIEKIVSLLDPSKYIIILDHQPNDYDAEAAAGADLVLSGHSHGGQLIVIRLVGELIGSNDRTYGIETRDKTTFIVSSGISDWKFRFKTGTRSEFCIIDVTHK